MAVPDNAADDLHMGRADEDIRGHVDGAFVTDPGFYPRQVAARIIDDIRRFRIFPRVDYGQLGVIATGEGDRLPEDIVAAWPAVIDREDIPEPVHGRLPTCGAGVADIVTAAALFLPNSH